MLGSIMSHLAPPAVGCEACKKKKKKWGGVKKKFDQNLESTQNGTNHLEKKEKKIESEKNCENES